MRIPTEGFCRLHKKQWRENEMNDIYERIAKYCEEKHLFARGDGVVAGLSGGADSVFLLEVLFRLQDRWGLRLCAVHVNHGIRGQEAQRDQDYAEAFARSRNVPIRVYQADIPKLARQRHMTEEEAGRAYRYQCFEECRRELDFQKLAVAHHQDDQAETVLFQLLRGSSLRGLGGMRPKRDRLVRPLLEISRKEIESALREAQIPYCNDTTNAQNIYARNRLRNEVIPYLQQEVQPEAAAHIARTGSHLQEVMDYIDAQRDEAYDKIVSGGEGIRSMQYEAYQALPAVLQREVILRMMEELAGKRKDITSVHLQMAAALFEGATGKEITLPYGIRAKKSYHTLSLYRQGEAEVREKKLPYLQKELVCGVEYELPLADGSSVRAVFEQKNDEKFSDANLKNHCTKCFDYDKIVTMPLFRYPERGDYLWLDQTGRTKKLQRLFIDEKVALDQRSTMVVLAEGHHILWVPALERCSAYYYVSDATKNVIYAYLQKEENGQEKGEHT
jgi:tRNA(Ile)-lysidine synthase